jgi:hypothetical protein
LDGKKTKPCHTPHSLTAAYPSSGKNKLPKPPNIKETFHPISINPLLKKRTAALVLYTYHPNRLSGLIHLKPMFSLGQLHRMLHLWHIIHLISQSQNTTQTPTCLHVASIWGHAEPKEALFYKLKKSAP